MRTHPHYGSKLDNSYVGEIVKFIDEHSGIPPIQKDALVNRLTTRPTREELDVASKEPIGRAA